MELGFDKLASVPMGRSEITQMHISALFKKAPAKIKAMFSPVDWGDWYSPKHYKAQNNVPKGMHVIGEDGAGNLLGFKDGNYYDHNHELGRTSWVKLS